MSESANAIRIELARRIVARKRTELEQHLVAAACYGSVAHNAAAAYSDVELVLLTDDTIAAREDLFFEQGIMVECDMLPASRMLAASQRVTTRWGIQADQYRQHLVLLDTTDVFPRLWAAAHDLSQADFEKALRESWWWSYEMRTKLLNACLVQDATRICSHGWDFAYSAAMRIALFEQKPYESGRTLWQDVTARGYKMKELVDLLTHGAIGQVRPAIDDVWAIIRPWGLPEGANTHAE